MSTQLPRWYELQLEDPSQLSGASVGSMIDVVATIFAPKFVIISDLEGLGLEQLSVLNELVVPFDDFRKLVADATHYEWAFFFLFRDLIGDHPYRTQEEELAAADLTIRLADDNYAYFYTRDHERATKLAETLHIVIREKTLETLEIMY